MKIILKEKKLQHFLNSSNLLSLFNNNNNMERQKEGRLGWEKGSPEGYS